MAGGRSSCSSRMAASRGRRTAPAEYPPNDPRSNLARRGRLDALSSPAYDRDMNGTLSAAWLMLLLQGAPSPIVRFDSREQGRTFYVDTDRSEIRKALRDVSAPSPAGEIPEWLPVYPGAAPWGQRGPNTPVDFGVSTYTTTAEPDAVFAHYESSARAAAGVTITSITRQPGRGGAFHANDATRSAVVSVSPGPGPTDISVNWRPKAIHPVVIASSARLMAVWYDDTKGVLRLRDPTTNKEYDLGMATMPRYARSVALEPSARADFPAWLAFYPGAKVIEANAPPVGWQPQKPADMRRTGARRGWWQQRAASSTSTRPSASGSQLLAAAATGYPLPASSSRLRTRAARGTSARPRSTAARSRRIPRSR